MQLVIIVNTLKGALKDALENSANNSEPEKLPVPVKVEDEESNQE